MFSRFVSMTFSTLPSVVGTSLAYAYSCNASLVRLAAASTACSWPQSSAARFGVISSGGAGAAAFSGATLLSVRNTIYAVQLKALLNPAGSKKYAAAQVTIDETMATATAQSTPAEQRRGFWVTGIAVFVFWNLMTLAGALVGNALGDPQRYGLDAAAAAAFTALLWPRLRSRDAAATMVLAIAIALLTSPLLPVGVPVILTVLAALVVGLTGHGRHERATKVEA